MTKYLETAKIKKHSETLGLHPYIGNKSVNMITRGQLRPRGHYGSRQLRGTTPEPRQRLHRLQDNDEIIPKIEDVNDLTGQEYFANEVNANEYFAKEAANNNNDIDEADEKYNNVMGFDKLLHCIRHLLRLLLSLGRLCDDWRRRPIRGTLHFLQRHEQDL
eukprot:4614901-Amphidinium_carterae.1